MSVRDHRQALSWMEWPPDSDAALVSQALTTLTTDYDCSHGTGASSLDIAH